MASNQRAKRFLTLSQHVEINKRPKKSWILLFKGKKTQNKSHKFFPLSHTHTVCSSAAGPQWKGQSWSREERTRPGHQLSKKHRAGSFQMAIVTSSGLRSQPEELWPAKVKTALLSGRTWTTNPKVFRDTRLLFWKMIHQHLALSLQAAFLVGTTPPRESRNEDGMMESGHHGSATLI